MSDDRVRAWAAALSEREADAFHAARDEFCRKPTADRLHMLRTAGRRLRSLYDDLGGVLPAVSEKGLRRIVKRAGKTRDATVLRAMLKAALDESEREIVAPILRDLRLRERAGLRRVRRAANGLKAR